MSDEQQEEIERLKAQIEAGATVMFTGLSVPKRDLDNAKVEHARACQDFVRRLKDATATTHALVEALEETCRYHNMRGSDGPCDCEGCRVLAALPESATEHRARDERREKALALAMEWIAVVRVAEMPGVGDTQQEVYRVVRAALEG